MCRTRRLAPVPFLAIVLSGLLLLSTGPLNAQTAEPAAASSSPTVVFTERPVVFPSGSPSISAKSVVGLYMLFADFAIDSFDMSKSDDVAALALITTILVLNFLAYEGFGLPNGAGFIGLNIVTGIAELVLLTWDRLFLIPDQKTVDVQRIALPNLDARQGLSSKGDYLGNYAIVTFSQPILEAHFATMRTGQFRSFSLALGTPTDLIWTALGLYVLLRNQNGLYFIPKVGNPVLMPLPFAPLHAIIGPNGHWFISDANAFLIHELTLALVEVAVWQVKSLVYGMSFLPSGELLFFYLPKTFALLDLNTKIETDYTLTGNRSVFDYKIRPGYFPPRILVDEFDNALQKGVVVELVIAGLLFNYYYGVWPRLNREVINYNPGL